MTTSFLCSTRRLAFSITISATCTWRLAGSSNVEEITSPRTERCISVTSSGRSSMSSTMRKQSGWLAVIAWAMFCSMTVLPALGGETSRPRWPLPMGAIRSITRAVRFSVEALSRSSPNRSVGWSGVRFSNRTLFLASSGFLRGADVAFDGVAGAQVEAAYLRGRDVDVVRPGEVGGVRRSQEAETVLQDFDHAFADDVLALFRLGLEDREDEVLFSQPAAAFDIQGRGHFGQLGGGLALEF